MSRPDPRLERSEDGWRGFVVRFLAVFVAFLAMTLAFVILIDPYDSGRFEPRRREWPVHPCWKTLAGPIQGHLEGIGRRCGKPTTSRSARREPLRLMKWSSNDHFGLPRYGPE